MRRLFALGQDLLRGRRGFHGVHADLLLVAALALEAHDAVHLGVEGIVAADAHVQAGMDVGATLAHKDVAGEGELTVGALGPQPRALAVAAVSGGAPTFFMGEKLKIQLQHDDVPPIR